MTGRKKKERGRKRGRKRAANRKQKGKEIKVTKLKRKEQPPFS